MKRLKRMKTCLINEKQLRQTISLSRDLFTLHLGESYPSPMTDNELYDSIVEQTCSIIYRSSVRPGEDGQSEVWGMGVAVGPFIWFSVLKHYNPKTKEYDDDVCQVLYSVQPPVDVVDGKFSFKEHKAKNFV